MVQMRFQLGLCDLLKGSFGGTAKEPILLLEHLVVSWFIATLPLKELMKGFKFVAVK